MFIAVRMSGLKISNTLTTAVVVGENDSKIAGTTLPSNLKTGVFKYLTSTAFCIIFAAPLEFDPVSDYLET